jgi:hypothetical protein
MSKKPDPTQKGASDTVTEDDESRPVTSVLDKREAAMKRVVEARQAEIDNPPEAQTHPEMYLDPTESDGDDPVPAPSAAAAVTEPVASDDKLGDDAPKPDAPKAPESPIFEKDGVQYMKLKVDGELVEMPLDKVISIQQKNLTADNRLRLASEKLKEADQLKADLLAQQERLKSSLTPPPTKKPGVEVNEEQIRNQANEFVNALFRGTQEEAVEKFAMFQKNQLAQGQSLIDIDELIAKVTETTEQRVNATLEQRARKDREAAENEDIAKGYKALQENFSELLNDDVLFGALDRRTEDLRVVHPDLSPSQIMLMAAAEVKAKLSPGAPSPTPAVTDKQARKDALKPVPLTRSSAARPTPTNKGPKSPTQIAEDMKRHRAALSGRA